LVASFLPVLLVVVLAVPAAAGSGTTTDAAPLPGPGRTEVAGARWGGTIAVGGGLVQTPDGGFTATDTLDLFDLASGTWTAGPALPGVRDHAVLVALRGDLYLVGGYGATLAEPTAEVWRLDAPDGSWERVADLSTPRAALAVVAVRGRLFAIGGVNESGVLNTTELYDPKTDTWSAGPDLAVPREHTGAAAVGNRVYAIAGRNPQNQTSVETIVVGPKGRPRGRWKATAGLGFSRGGNAATTVAGIPCTAGGEAPSGTIAEIECLRDGEWEHVADLRVPRHGLAVVGEGRRLHIISGGPEPGAFYSTTHEVLEL
jgi:hypothetical protein